MHNLEVVLTVVASNVSKKDVNILLFNENDCLRLPSSPVILESVVEVAARLLKENTGLNARVGNSGWVELIQCPIVDDPARLVNGERLIAVPYTCMIPEMSRSLRGARWMSLQEIRYEKMYLDHLDILQSACRRV